MTDKVTENQISEYLYLVPIDKNEMKFFEKKEDAESYIESVLFNKRTTKEYVCAKILQIPCTLCQISYTLDMIGYPVDESK